MSRNSLVNEALMLASSMEENYPDLSEMLTQLAVISFAFREGFGA